MRDKLPDSARCGSRYVHPKHGRVVRCAKRNTLAHEVHINEAPGYEIEWTDGQATPPGVTR